ncbi:hypothetical protein H2203_004509 [Taxawa tesnikishii (nom. ined.)]|nr:hypothetical protein H2203_004509 [Dothideales sp. JES 119]
MSMFDRKDEEAIAQTPNAASAHNLTRVDQEVSLQRSKTRTDEPPESDIEIVDWDGPDDPKNPFNWPTRKKWILTITVLLGTFTVLINGTIITVAWEDINHEFGISDAHFPNSFWPVTSWTIGGGIFMMILLPVLEDFGMRLGYLISYFLFIIFLIPQALANSFATLIVVRFFAGGCVSLIANITCSTICDVWVGDRGRTVPMSLYITAYLAGSSISPVIGGAIHKNLASWRWILWIQLIWTGIFFPIFFFLFRETRASILLRRKAAHIRRKTGRKAYTRDELDAPPLTSVLLESVKRPIYMLCTEYVVFSFTLWSAFSVGMVYLFTQSVEQVFTALYGWDSSSAGYVQGAVVIGQLVGWPFQILGSKLYFASASRNTETPGMPIPEARLYMSILGGFVGMTGGMFVYGWASYPWLPWIAPTMGLGMVGFGIELVVCGIADYVTDCYSKYAASAVAAVACGENVFAGFLPFAAASMYSTLGFQWASSLLGFLALLLAMAPVLLLFKGRAIRARSPFIREAQHEVKMNHEAGV